MPSRWRWVGCPSKGVIGISINIGFYAGLLHLHIQHHSLIASALSLRKLACCPQRTAMTEFCPGQCCRLALMNGALSSPSNHCSAGWERILRWPFPVLYCVFSTRATGTSFSMVSEPGIIVSSQTNGIFLVLGTLLSILWITFPCSCSLSQSSDSNW